MISTLKKLQAKKAAQENNGGFTLIELLIVIVVLGILAAVVVFSLGGVTGSSAVAACQADGATVNTGIAAYAAQNGGTLPTTQSQLTSGSGAPLQTWPANYSHYTFALDASGVLWLKAGATQQTVPTGGTNAAFKTDGSWTQWSGAASCGSGTGNAGVK